MPSPPSWLEEGEFVGTRDIPRAEWIADDGEYREYLLTTEAIRTWTGIDCEYDLEEVQFNSEIDGFAGPDGEFAQLEAVYGYFYHNNGDDLFFPKGQIIAGLLAPRGDTTPDDLRRLHDRASEEYGIEAFREHDEPGWVVRDGEFEGYRRTVLDADDIEERQEPASRDYLLVQTLPNNVLIMLGDALPEAPSLKPTIETYAGMMGTLARTRGIRALGPDRAARWSG